MRELREVDIDQRSEIQEALSELLAWEDLIRSPRLSAFLNYVVEARLRGDEASIKAYSIAVDVFGRGEDFDPQTDPIVRVQARRLRALLDSFYESGQARAPVRIVMPVGRYVPLFLENEPGQVPPPETAATPSDGRGWLNGTRGVWIAGGATALLLLIFLASFYLWFGLHQPVAPVLAQGQPGVPLVIVGEFQNLGGDERERPLAAGLAVELVTDINQFPDLQARYGGSRPQVSQDDLDRSDAVYILSGVVRPTQGGVQYSVLLHDENAEDILARYELDVQAEDVEDGLSIEEVATHFALRLGNPRGPLHEDARDWLLSDASRDILLSPYPCLVAYSMFREGHPGIERERVVECAQAGADRGVANSTAILGALVTDAAWRTGEETPQIMEARREGAELTGAAVEAEPLNSFVWTQRGFATFLGGGIALARDYYNTAMQLNPASVDLIAEYAFTEAHLGNWTNANRLSAIALSVEGEPPDPYFAVPAFWALRNGNYAEAIVHAQRMIDKIPHTGAAILVAAGGYLEDSSIIEIYLPRLLAAPRFKRLGIMPALEFSFSDRPLLDDIADGLVRAGVPPDRLYAPF